MINASFRSGTNEFRGSLWEYHRNTALNAVGFFKPVRNEKPSLIRNQFGLTFGGPIQRDRSFFFLHYEGFREVSSQLRFATIPTLEQRQGMLGVPIRHPLAGQLFANGVIPAAQITPFARKVLDSLPAPQHPGLANNFENSPRATAFTDKFDIKIDHHVSQKLSSFVRISQRKANEFAPPAIPLPIGSPSNAHVRTLNQQLAGGVTYVPTGRSLLEYRLAVNRTLAGKTPAGVGGPGMHDLYGIPGLPTDPKLTGGLNSQNISGFTNFGRQSTNPQFQNPFVVNNRVNFSRIMGRQSLKLGYEYQAINTEVDDLFAKYGEDTYSGQFSRPAGAPANTAMYNLADFMFGARSAYNLQLPFIANLRQRMHFGYIQNDIKLAPQLTLNLGMRYEYATPQYERDNQLANYDPERRILIYAKNGSIGDRALVDPDRNNFGGGFGLAWSVTPRTVVRMGYGVSYVHFNRVGPRNLLALSGKHALAVRIAQLPTNPLCQPNSDPLGCFRPTMMGYPADLVTPEKFDTKRSSINFLPRDMRNGYLQNWHFTIQRQVSRDWLVDIGYVGNLGVKMGIMTDYNQARPNGPAENLTLQARRPLQDFARIQMFFPGGVSTYHSLQMKLV